MSISPHFLISWSLVSIAKNIKPSTRGEMEITDVNRAYLDSGNLNVQIFGRGFAWLDTGTHDSLLEASQFVQTLEHRPGLKIACLEEIALHNSWITSDQLRIQIKTLEKTGYGKYLKQILDEYHRQ